MTIFTRVWLWVVLLWGRIVERFMREGAFKRAEFFVEKMKPFLVGSNSVLDLGCGTLHIGALLKQELDVDVHAVDTKAHWGYIGERLIGLPCARFLARKYSIPLTLYDGERLPFSDGAFDTVLVAFALHHAKNPDAVLAEAIRVSRGRVILLEDTPETAKEKRINHISDAVVNLELGGPDNGRTKEEWRQAFSRLGVRLVHEESWTSKMGLLTFFNTMFVLDK